MGIEFVFIARQNFHGHRRVPAGSPDFPIEFRWINENPDLFEEVFRGPPVDERGPWAVLFRRKASSPP
jgi:hypothetical protein